VRVPSVERRRRPFRIRGWIIAIAVVLVVLVFSLSSLARFYTDYLWFDSVGFSDVWRELLLAKIAPAAFFTLIFFAMVFASLTIADRLAPRVRTMGPEDEFFERYQQAVGRYAGRIRAGISALIAVIAGASAAGQWEEWILFRNYVSFGIDDPQFGKDVGFYVFQLPFIKFVVDWFFAALVIVLIATVIAHYFNGGIRLQSPYQRVTPQVKAHLSVILALMALVKAVGYYYARFELNFSTRGVVEGASYTDVNAQLPALTLLTVIAVIAAGLFIWNIWRRGWVLPIIAVGLWALISLIVGTLYPAFVQNFRVNPNELAKERKYIRRNIVATRQAFNLDNESVTVKQFDYATDLTTADLLNNQQTIGNARLWDPTELLANYRSFQQIGTFYQFGDADVDRYRIDGQDRQVLLSARELNQANLPSQSWVSRHLVYTHGYGLAASPSNAVGEGGGPAYVLRDIPPDAENPVFDLTRPEIYFSENLGGFSLVDSRQREFNFPREGRAEATTRYEGTGGVALSSWLRRAAFALRFTDYNVLISGQITPQTKVLYLRDIRERAAKAAPFLKYDNDPYPVILDGKVLWVLDGYTTTNRYPYSQSTSSDTSVAGFNYVRNPVKVTVDAYDGTVRFYVIDERDPMIRAYRKAFPGLFTDQDEMPDGLREHLRYPEDLFTVQTDTYASYHMTDPTTFFNKTDLWEVSPDPGSGQLSISESGVVETTPTTNQPEAARSTGLRIDPIYLQIRLPGEEQEEFLILRPYVPVSRNNQLTNLASFMVGKSDPDSYGELETFVMPSGRTVPGPSQIDSQILTTDEISSEFSLLGRTGSTVIQGSLQLIPVENSILYIRPIYVQARSGSRLPSFRFVVVVYGNQAKLGTDLLSALAQFDEFAGIAPTQPQTPSEPGEAEEPGTTPESEQTVEELVTRANEQFAAAQDALDAGDLGRFQELIEEVGRLLARAQQAGGGGESVSPSTTTTTTQADGEQQAAGRR
jgi:uncharacterized membrane protein (UPF0182 family)